MNNTVNPKPDQGNPSMSLDDARKVMWLKSYHKPLGELLDEGFLNQSRLEWAASKAYEQRLRQAAHVLLDWQKKAVAKPALEAKKVTPPFNPDTPFPLGITLEQARATPWPYGPHKGQSMGTLVETRLVSLKDLGAIVENTWDKREKEPAESLPDYLYEGDAMTEVSY